MKIKNLSILAAALLSLSMLFASCDKAQTNNDPTETQPSVQGAISNGAAATTTVGKAETAENGLSYQLHTVIASGEQFYAVYGIGSSKAAELVIPATFKDIPVKAIGSSAFRGSKLLTSVTIPDSVTSIGDMAFENCDSLTTVTVGSGVETIGKRAFSGCDLLSKITLGEGLKSIGYEAFQSAVLLVDLALPQSLNEIGERAFWGCYKLENVTIGDQLTAIGRDAFYACGSIKYTEEDGVFYLGNATNKHLLLAGFSDRTVATFTVHTDTKYVAQGVFSNCEALTTVILPAGIALLCDASFEYCPLLTSIEFQGTKASWDNVTKGYLWDYGTGNYTVKCSDGSLVK